MEDRGRGFELLLAFVVVLLVAFMLIATYSKNQMCDYKIQGSEYEYVDGTHYNCCKKQTIMTDEGHYAKEKCKGFKR